MKDDKIKYRIIDCLDLINGVGGFEWWWWL